MATESDSKSAYQGYLLKLGELRSGAPQGSVLAPVPFTIIMNDLDKQVQRTHIKFAEDTKLSGIANNMEDRNKLKGDLESKMHRIVELEGVYKAIKSNPLLIARILLKAHLTDGCPAAS